MEPLEEVYYALAELRDTAESGHLSLLMTTTGTAWSNGRLTGSNRRAGDRGPALRSPDQELLLRPLRLRLSHTADDADTAVWYLDGEAARERVRMAALFGVDQLCLSDLSSVADYENYSLLEGLD